MMESDARSTLISGPAEVGRGSVAAARVAALDWIARCTRV